MKTKTLRSELIASPSCNLYTTIYSSTIATGAMNRKVLLVVPILLIVAVFAFWPVYQEQQSGLSGKVVMSVKLTVILGHPNDKAADLGLVWEGYSPSCWAFCNGVTYTLDPTVHIANGGMDCIQFKVHGVKSGTTCSVSSKSAAGNQNATYLMVSASSGHTPAFTDTSCPATVATTNGFSIAAGTPTAGTPSSGSEVFQLTTTWKGATGATASLDDACISWTNSNAANTLYAQGQIGTTTVNVGDTLQTLWQITYASS